MFEAKSIVLIGHRGVGKTTCLKTLAEFLPHYQFFDLDEEIEKETEQPLIVLFHQLGEEAFRSLESRVYQKLSLIEERKIISVGAGFRTRFLQNSDFVIWLKRTSDEWGRIFTDRPRLDSSLSALQEYSQRKQTRDPLFLERADLILHLPEGETRQTLTDLLFRNATPQSCFLTLTPWHLQRPQRLAFLKSIQNLGFELRSDYLSADQINQLRNELCEKSLIVSIRDLSSVNLAQDSRSEKLQIDWDLETQYSGEEVDVLSYHGADFSVVQKHCSKNQFKLFKWSPEVKDFAQLRMCHEWYLQNPKRFLFFPRSQSGRWKWYRQWQMFNQKINFVSNEISNYADQVHLLEALGSLKSERFAAVLGSPIGHSFSPTFHRRFFESYGLPFYAIDLKENEFTEAMDFLQSLGLVAAAVTSPLKKKAFEFCSQKSAISLQLESVNTLSYLDEAWLGDNTDAEGFVELSQKVPPTNGSVAIWGGGGVLSVVMSCFKKAERYSSTSDEEIKKDYKGWVWAAPPDRPLPKYQSPPQWILDLNYREDSRAKEFAILSGAQYVSGLVMFAKQALEQQKIWERIFVSK